LCSEDDVGETPLHWAIREGHDSLVSILLESLANTQFASPPSYVPTSLFSSSLIGCGTDADFIYFSLEQPVSYTPAGFLVHSQGMTVVPIQAHPNEDGESPLHLAACVGSAPIVSRLLRQGAPPNLRYVGVL
jgi:ankyrin repeat protein